MNHKNHPLGRTQFSEKAKAKVKKEATGKAEGEKKSPNGRPLPPGTARVTPLKALNAIQKKQAAEEKKLEEERLLLEKQEAERRAQEEAAKAKEEAEKKALAEKESQEKAKRPTISGIAAKLVPGRAPAKDTTGERKSSSFGAGKPAEKRFSAGGEATAEEKAERMGTLQESPVSVLRLKSLLLLRLRRLWRSRAEQSMMLQSRKRRFTATRTLKMRRQIFPRRIVLPESRISTALPSPMRETSR